MLNVGFPPPSILVNFLFFGEVTAICLGKANKIIVFIIIPDAKTNILLPLLLSGFSLEVIPHYYFHYHGVSS